MRLPSQALPPPALFDSSPAPQILLCIFWAGFSLGAALLLPAHQVGKGMGRYRGTGGATAPQIRVAWGHASSPGFVS